MKIRFLYDVEEQKKQDNLRCLEGLYDLARRAWLLVLGVARIVFSSIGRRFAGSRPKIGRVVCQMHKSREGEDEQGQRDAKAA